MAGADTSNGLLNFFSPPVSSPSGFSFPNNGGLGGFGNSGVASMWQSGNQAVGGALRALERDGLVRRMPAGWRLTPTGALALMADGG